MSVSHQSNDWPRERLVWLSALFLQCSNLGSKLECDSSLASSDSRLTEIAGLNLGSSESRYYRIKEFSSVGVGSL